MPSCLPQRVSVVKVLPLDSKLILPYWVLSCSPCSAASLLGPASRGRWREAAPLEEPEEIPFLGFVFCGVSLSGCGPLRGTLAPAASPWPRHLPPIDTIKCTWLKSQSHCASSGKPEPAALVPSSGFWAPAPWGPWSERLNFNDSSFTRPALAAEPALCISPSYSVPDPVNDFISH